MAESKSENPITSGQLPNPIVDLRADDLLLARRMMEIIAKQGNPQVLELDQAAQDRRKRAILIRCRAEVALAKNLGLQAFLDGSGRIRIEFEGYRVGVKYNAVKNQGVILSPGDVIQSDYLAVVESLPDEGPETFEIVGFVSRERFHVEHDPIILPDKRIGQHLKPEKLQHISKLRLIIAYARLIRFDESADDFVSEIVDCFNRIFQFFANRAPGFADFYAADTSGEFRRISEAAESAGASKDVQLCKNCVVEFFATCNKFRTAGKL